MFEDMMAMYERGKQEVSNIWDSIDSVKTAAQASDAIKTAAGTPENANMVKAIEESRSGGAPVELEAGIFEDTTADTVVADLEAEDVPDIPSSVDDVIASVEEVFPSKGFLAEIAIVESKKGEDPNTYREGYHGGVMQVDKIGFEDTQDTKSHPALVNKFKMIKDEFGIDWPKASWQDLRDPLHSTIAARLLLSNKEADIPDTVEGRASYWKDKYNTVKGKGTTAKYLKSLGK
mgnify:FL=1|tara:strand:- start:65 stop:763 length:699 start_codon:yes stop_codon:yes gene_type:complete